MPGAQDTLKARPPPWSTAWAGTHRLRARYGWQGDGAACLVDADSGMARLEGFEPPTNGFGSHYSIRLSYRRADRHFPLSGRMLRGVLALPLPHVLRTLRGPAPHGARLAHAPAPVLDADARRPADRLAAAAVADLVGAVARGRGRAAAMDPVRVHRRGVADPRGRLRDQRLRRPLAGSPCRAHPRTPARHRPG